MFYYLIYTKVSFAKEGSNSRALAKEIENLSSVLNDSSPVAEIALRVLRMSQAWGPRMPILWRDTKVGGSQDLGWARIWAARRLFPLPSSCGPQPRGRHVAAGAKSNSTKLATPYVRTNINKCVQNWRRCRHDADASDHTGGSTQHFLVAPRVKKVCAYLERAWIFFPSHWRKCIQNGERGAYWNYQEGIVLKLSRGECVEII